MVVTTVVSGLASIGTEGVELTCEDMYTFQKTPAIEPTIARFWSGTCEVKEVGCQCLGPSGLGVQRQAWGREGTRLTKRKLRTETKGQYEAPASIVGTSLAATMRHDRLGSGQGDSLCSQRRRLGTHLVSSFCWSAAVLLPSSALLVLKLRPIMKNDKLL